MWMISLLQTLLCTSELTPKIHSFVRWCLVLTLYTDAHAWSTSQSLPTGQKSAPNSSSAWIVSFSSLWSFFTRFVTIWFVRAKKKEETYSALHYKQQNILYWSKRYRCLFGFGSHGKHSCVLDRKWNLGNTALVNRSYVTSTCQSLRE